MIKKGNTVVVDVRDAPEVSASGKIAGAGESHHGGRLEFAPTRDSPYHDKNFDRKDRYPYALPAVVCVAGTVLRLWTSSL